jgi:hypothetical protein
VIRGDQRLHMALDHDGFAKEQPIVVSDDLSSIRFRLENRGGDAHNTGLYVSGLAAGDYAVSVDGRSVGTVKGGAEETRVSLPVGTGASAQVTIVRK